MSARTNLLILLHISLLGFFCLPKAWSNQDAPRVAIKHPRNGARLFGPGLLLQVEAKGRKPRLFVTAVITYPGGATERISVTDDGLLEDDRPADGVFTRRLTHLRVPGEYTVRAKAWDGRVESWSGQVSFTFIPDGLAQTPGWARLGRPWLLLLAPWLTACALIVAVLFWTRKGVTKVVSACETAAKDARRTRLLTEGLCEALEKTRQTMLPGPEGQTSLPKLRSSSELDSELMELRLTIERYRQEIEDWKRTAMEYMDALQRGIELYGPDDPRTEAMRRDADVFARFCSARGLDRIIAKPGDPLVEDLYQVIGEEKIEGMVPGTIAYCTEWGYRCGTELYKRAKVVIAS